MFTNGWEFKLNSLLKCGKAARDVLSFFLHFDWEFRHRTPDGIVMVKKDGKTGRKGDKGSASVDKRKPKHSGDANRPSKSVNGQRDAATVGIFDYVWYHGFLLRTVFRLISSIKSLLFSPSSAYLRSYFKYFLPYQVRRLAMYKKRPVRNKKGKVIHEVSYHPSCEVSAATTDLIPKSSASPIGSAIQGAAIHSHPA